MFKKPATVAFKGETRLRGKEGKVLREAVSARFGGEDCVAAFLPPKADVLVRKVGGGASVSFTFVDGDCMLFQPDGRANISDAELVPTLPALWKGAALLPVVLIHRPVAKFVFRGADVMAPGVHSVEPGAGATPSVGSLVAVCAVGNPSACAVGRLKMPVASLNSRGCKGDAVEVLHYFGDCLWEACGSPRPDGFVGDTIQATQSVADGGADDSSEGEDAEQAALPPTGTSENQVPINECEADREEGDRHDPAGIFEIQPSPESMSNALDECLFQAIKSRLKDKDLPMSGNALYAQHMRPCRRVGTTIDVKASTFKKLVTFLAHCDEMGWIALKKNAAEPTVTKVFRDHPDVREWRPWPKSETAEAADVTTGSGEGKLSSIEVEPVWRIAKLKSLVDALGVETAKVMDEGDGHCTRSECSAALKNYADRKELWQKNNRKRIGLDDLLQGLVSGSKGGDDWATAHSLEGLTDKILANLPPCHRVLVPQGGAIGGFKKSVRSGKPPVVQVRTDTRRGHSVTLIHGLEAYGVDMDALAACLQKALATSVAVEEASAQIQAGIMVQGFWDKACSQWLEKIGVPSESVQNAAKKGQQQKKVKQGSNIVKS